MKPLQAQELAIRAAELHQAVREQDMARLIFLELLKKELGQSNTNDIDKGKAVTLMMQAVDLAVGAEAAVFLGWDKSLVDIRTQVADVRLKLLGMHDKEQDPTMEVLLKTLALMEEHGVDVVAGKFFGEKDRTNVVNDSDFTPKPTVDEQGRDAAAHIEERTSVAEPKEERPEDEGREADPVDSADGPGADQGTGAVDKK